MDIQRLEAAVEANPLDYAAADALQKERVRRGLHPSLGKCAVARIRPGHWELEDNDVWNVPEGREELRFQFRHPVGWPGGPLTGIRGLAIDKFGNVYGDRVLHDLKVPSGYNREGRVSIGGRKYRAFTSSKLFQRPDGSLIDVGVLWVIHGKADLGRNPQT